MTTDADIRLEGVTKQFGETTAVDDLTLSIPRGAFYALLGPSGCGKTTTLRIVGGFEDPTAGRVFLGGDEVTQLPPYKRDVNTVFQSYALFPHLTVERNVAFGLERRKVSKSEVTQRVNETLEMVQLGGYGRRKPAQIELKRIQRDVGITFVHVTHDQEEAMSMADTIAVMSDGKIEQAGSAADLYERPRTEFVANFLGVSNLVDARMRASQNGHSTVETHDGATLHVPSDRIGPHGTDAVRIGVRPEKVTLSPADATVAEGSNVLRGTVVVASFLGVSIQYVIRAAGGEELTVFAQNLDGAEPKSLGPGREVQLAWDPQHTFVVAKEGVA
jgi:spermidine/putrescine transport system ATP-binding protein